MFCLFLRDLGFDLLDHLGELGFAFVAGGSVDVEFLAFAVWKARIEAAFPEVIVNLIHASRTAFANLPRGWLTIRLCGRTRRVYGRVLRYRGLPYLGHLGVRFADMAVDVYRRLHLHGVGHVAVNIKSCRRRDMTDGRRQWFHVNSVFQCQGYEDMEQIVEAYTFEINGQ